VAAPREPGRDEGSVLAGMGLFMLLLLEIGPLLVGALVGGLLV